MPIDLVIDEREGSSATTKTSSTADGISAGDPTSQDPVSPLKLMVSPRLPLQCLSTLMSLCVYVYCYIYIYTFDTVLTCDVCQMHASCVTSMRCRCPDLSGR
ncbi:hypothetical protein LSH36_118g07077 [Paralvinella palmiformis]|uniref:Uncharacterized protein n=1 Tax=Paralvinella palmiformis TaxID=53620 RepID=A0AAD9JYN4_9ANNE|nr:hypothetical protein LSH36_118g07077 [Paralvinella palmiformis]